MTYNITYKLQSGIYKAFLNSILVFIEIGMIIPIINKFFPNLSGKIYPNNLKE